MREIKLENTYGLTHYGGVTEDETLTDALKRNGIPFVQKYLNMGTFFAEPASIVTHTSRKTGKKVSVLVIPMVGADTWGEEYFYFVGMTHQQAVNTDWYDILDDLRRVVRRDGGY